MDVVALYPLIMRGMAKEAVLEAISTTDIRWDNVDVTNLTRHVAMTSSREDIDRMGIRDIILVPKGTTTFRSFLDPRKNARTTN